MQTSTKANNNWLRTDRTKLSLLLIAVLSSGLFSGILMLNVFFFIIALSALVLLIVRFGYGYAALAIFGSGALCIALYGQTLYGQTMFVALSFMVFIPGIIMGYKSRTFCSPHSVIFMGMLPFLFPIAFVVISFPELNSQAPEMISQMQNILAENAGVLGLGDSQFEMMNASIKTTVEWTLRLFPGMLFTVFISITLFAYLGALSISLYFNTNLPRFKPLFLWKAGELWLVPLGISLLFILAGGLFMKTIGENVLFFMVHLYAFFGICFVDFHFRKIKIPVPVRVIIYLLVLVIMVMIIPVLAVLGIADSRFDFRKVSQFGNKDIK